MTDALLVTIDVRYSCRECGIVRAQVAVTARTAGEPLAPWMASLKHALAADHRRRSPGCHPPTLSEVLIPVGGALVGGPTVQ